jgi:hypothetical protein
MEIPEFKTRGLQVFSHVLSGIGTHPTSKTDVFESVTTSAAWF